MSDEKPIRPIPMLRVGVVLGMAIVAIVVLSYSNSFSGVFVFDDLPAIQSNLSIRDLSRVRDVLLPSNSSGTTVNGRPLVNLSFALNYANGGLAVAGYHVVNLAIHGLAALVLFGVARRLFSVAWPRRALNDGALASEGPTIAAAVLAALWCSHPMQTQSVIYVVQRAESLVGLWILLTFYCFCKAQDSRHSNLWLAASVVNCLFGVFTKEVVAAVPLLVLICDRSFYGMTYGAALRTRRSYYLALFATWIPLLASIIYGRGRGGTVGFNLDGVTWWNYLLTQSEAIVRYLWTVIWPSSLVFDYGTGIVSSLLTVWWQSGLIVFLLTWTVVAMWRWPKLGFLGAWFFLILAPSSSFVPIVTETAAEHRMYLPIVAVMALGVVCIFNLFSVRRLWLGGLAFVVVALGVMTFRRNYDYHNAERLWASSVRNFPQSARAHNNLAEIFGRRRDFDRAVWHLREAIRIQPRYLDALCNLAGIFSQIGRSDEALILMEGLVKGNPRETAVQSTYGGVLYRLGRREEAAQFFRRALELTPLDLDSNNNLGVYLYEENRPEEALRHFQVVLSIQPNDSSALFNTANALVKLGQLNAAEEKLRQTIAVDPARYEAYNNLGALLAQRGLKMEATEQFRKAVEISPKFPDALNNWGVMLSEAGRTNEAVTLFERAIQARPDYSDAKENLRRSLEARANGPERK